MLGRLDRVPRRSWGSMAGAASANNKYGTDSEELEMATSSDCRTSQLGGWPNRPFGLDVLCHSQR